MSVDQRSLLHTLADTAAFRTWGQAIAAQLVSTGLVKTSDTGQIDWTSVSKPGAANTIAGYEIYRFADALQATKPIFVKIEYVTGNTATAPGLYVSAGTGTNGAGTLTGNIFSQCGAVSQSVTSGNGESYVSGSQSGTDGGRLAIASNVNSGSNLYGFVFMIERTRDANGVATNDGFACFAGSFYSGGKYQVVPHSGAIPASVATFPADPMSGQQSKVGVEVALSPIPAKLGKALGMLSPLIYVTGDIANNTQFEVEHLGEVRNFIALQYAIPDSRLTYGAVAGRSLAMLWE